MKTVFFLDVFLDLLVGGIALGSGEVGVFQIDRHTDCHIRIFSDQLNNRLHMPWDNSVNKNAHIHAIAATAPVEQFPVTYKVEWAALMASLLQTGIYKINL